MKFSELSMRTANVGGRIYSIHHPHTPCYVMASKALVRQVILDGSIAKVRGAGRMTINELRRYAGMKPETIKRCPCCGQTIPKKKI